MIFLQGIPKDSPYETLSWETSSERHAKDDEEVDGYSVPRFLTSEIIKTSSSQSPADKVPEKAKPLADNPPEEDKVYAVVKKVKKKEVTPSDIVLRHIQPPSLRSSSVEDVSKDTAVVTKPYRASMPPDLLLEHSPSLQTDVNVVPPISLSPEPGESLLLPSSDYSINKLQVVYTMLLYHVNIMAWVCTQCLFTIHCVLSLCILQDSSLCICLPAGFHPGKNFREGRCWELIFMSSFKLKYHHRLLAIVTLWKDMKHGV